MNQQFSGAAAIRAATMIMGSTYVTYGLGLLTSILVARSLGPDEFGRYSYVVWVAGVLVALGTNGLTTTAIRFVSESLGVGSAASARSVHGWLRRRQYACLALVAVGFIVLTPLFTPSGWEGHLGGFIAAALCAAIAKAVFLFDVSVAKGYGRFGVEAKSAIGMSVVNAVAVVVLVLLDAPLMAYLALFTAVSVCYALAARLMLLSGGVRPSHEPLEPSLDIRVRRHLLWTVVLTLSYAFSNKSVETYLLNAWVGSAAVGFFAIAAALTRGGIDLLSSGLTAVLMPMMAHAFGEGGTERVNTILASAIRYFMFIGLLLAGVGTLVAEPAVALMYGESYGQVVTPLRVMILVGGLTMTEGAFNALLSTTDNQRLRVGYAVFSIVMTIGFAVFLIPRHGLMGAVMAHAASSAIVFLLMTWGITRMMSLRMPWRELWLQSACAAVAALPAVAVAYWIPGTWTGFVAGALYAVLFVSFGMAFKAWRSSDAMQVASLLERYPSLHRRIGPPLGRWATGLPADPSP